MRIRNLLLITLFALLLGACNLPRGNATPTASQSDLVLTAAAATVAAQLTLDAAPGAATDTPVSSNTPTTGPSNTPAATATNTQVPSPCDLAGFVADVTIPDGTQFTPGDTFTKTWRLINNGTCTWTSTYEVVFDSGDSMGGPASQALGSSVVPGGTIDISLNLTAPASSDTYRGNWKLRNDGGTIFALTNNSPFFVEIEVIAPDAPTSTATSVPTVSYNFYNQAATASWIGGGGGGGGTVLTFGGPDTDTDGFAMYKGGQTLEDGSAPTNILETHPKWVDDGVISGEFSAYTVQNGDRFRAEIGFLAPGGSCGAGDVVFQFNYKEGGSLSSLDSWTKSCDGTLTTIDIDLSSLAGKSLNFVFAVLANGPSAQDWAVWVNPRIEQ
ncbi:MAG: hypothetical protein HND51_09210 [Chloroflexi bacterium]|nr:hypothetical protein [Chloroflexota bacterium]